jgi:hypothetical protein
MLLFVTPKSPGSGILDTNVRMSFLHTEMAEGVIVLLHTRWGSGKGINRIILFFFEQDTNSDSSYVLF